MSRSGCFDDGVDYDWVDWMHPTCGRLKSYKRILEEFKATTWGLLTSTVFRATSAGSP